MSFTVRKGNKFLAKSERIKFDSPILREGKFYEFPYRDQAETIAYISGGEVVEIEQFRESKEPFYKIVAVGNA